jgi:toxin YoeB
MIAAKRNRRRQQTTPVLTEDERRAILLRAFRNDLVHWIRSEPQIALRIMRLIEEVLRDPFSGVGKPEPLKHEFGGDWSRRITDKDRLVYTVSQSGIFFSRARGHYRQH